MMNYWYRLFKNYLYEQSFYNANLRLLSVTCNTSPLPIPPKSLIFSIYYPSTLYIHLEFYLIKEIQYLI